MKNNGLTILSDNGMVRGFFLNLTAAVTEKSLDLPLIKMKTEIHIS